MELWRAARAMRSAHCVRLRSIPTISRVLSVVDRVVRIQDGRIDDADPAQVARQMATGGAA